MPSLSRPSEKSICMFDFLNDLLETEVVERQRHNMEVRTKLAQLPYRKTLNEFDLAFQPSIDEKLLN